MSKDEFSHFIKDLEKQMLLAADNLEFEKAAKLRDEIEDLKKIKKTPSSSPLSRGRK